MKLHSKYLEDQSFIQWVYFPNKESDSYWESYIKKHPKEAHTIHTLKGVLLSLKTKEVKISGKEKQDLLYKIVQKTIQRKKGNAIYRIAKETMRYAAILLIAAGIGFYYFSYIKKSDTFYIEKLSTHFLDSISDTQLTLDSGKKYSIKEEKSDVMFTNTGSVIVNKKDTLSSIKHEIEEESLSELIVPYGKRSKITLSDGTVVHLNAGSRFVFPEKFVGNQRKVLLVGEAFFEVHSNKEKPFVVKTLEEDMSIKVVGTKFNVSAYPTDESITTVLKEGEVHIVKQKNIFQKTATVLKPGQLALWDKKEGKIELATVNTDNYTLWTEGLLYFQSESLVNITKKLERFYNIEIEYVTTFDNKIHITGKLDLNEEMNLTLENLELTATIKIEKITARKYIIK